MEMEYSPYYPYEKVQTGYLTMQGTEEIPYQIIQYLLDLPDATGYAPTNDNTRPRVRLAKLLFLLVVSGRCVGDTQKLSFFEFLCTEFGIGCNQFGFRNAV